MNEIINQFLIYLISLAANYPMLASILSVIGGVVLAATVLKPVVFWLVAKTQTDKDNILASKFYGVIEGTAIDFKPFVALFRKRKPNVAGALDKFKITDKDDV